jgi:hypothetical protein
VLFNDDSEITLWIQKLAAKFYTGADVNGTKIEPMKEQMPWPNEFFWSITTCGYYEGPTNKTLSLTAPAPPSVMGHLIRLFGQGKKKAKAAHAKMKARDAAFNEYKNDETVIWSKVNEEAKEDDTGESASNPDEESSEEQERKAAKTLAATQKTDWDALSPKDKDWDALSAKDKEKSTKDSGKVLGRETYQNLAADKAIASVADKAKAEMKTGRDEHGNKVKVLTNRDLASFSWLMRLDHADDLGSTVPKRKRTDPSKMTRVWRIFYQHR